MADDVKGNWLNLARKCQSICGTQPGFSIMEMRVMVGPGGEPVFWTEPRFTKIEPMRNSTLFLHQVIEKMLE